MCRPTRGQHDNAHKGLNYSFPGQITGTTHSNVRPTICQAQDGFKKAGQRLVIESGAGLSHQRRLEFIPKLRYTCNGWVI